MQHVWEFHISMKDKEKKPIHLYHKTESNRRNKVCKSILKDMKKHLGVKEEDIEDFHIRQLR